MTDGEKNVDEVVEEAAETLASVWPLHSFVAANPLSGYEDRGFHEALELSHRRHGAEPYPDVDTLERAWSQDNIDDDVLRSKLDKYDVELEPEDAFQRLEQARSERPGKEVGSGNRDVDRLTAKWLSMHLDEGQAGWSMPCRDEGFYQAWRHLASYDGEIPEVDGSDDLPGSAEEAVADALDGYGRERQIEICRHHLESLSGWSGYIRRRNQDPHDPWKEEAPVTLTDYLAVRFELADLLEASIEPPAELKETESQPLQRAFLEAWEDSYRRQLLQKLKSRDDAEEETDADAKLVFCIDTRSEVIRRKIEQEGAYDTHGYAGFFGVPMLHEPRGDDHPYAACPPIVEPEHHVESKIRLAERQKVRLNRHYNAAITASRKHLKSMKNNVVAAFPFVEGAGTAYGAAMAVRTMTPGLLHRAYDRVKDVVGRPAEFTQPDIRAGEDSEGERGNDFQDVGEGIPLEARVEIAEDAFLLMGWKELPPVVAFVGHASETTNNAFDSSLDCGACAGQPGGPNAKVLAEILNDVKVRSRLRERGHEIPEDTVFVAGQHNTTTDEVTLYTDEAPPGQDELLKQLEDDVDAARELAAEERRSSLHRVTEDDGAAESERRAFDWAETQPEWGLAGNAAFVVAPRDYTRDVDLEGRVFLHSYDWESDPEAEALEAILAGPAVVTQMINNHYYFATVDDSVYGSGSKTTQNPVGNAMVYQGNAGDIMTGLPRESLRKTDDETYHDPLRLTTVVKAPRSHLEEALGGSDRVKQLFDNGWMHLVVVDPDQDDDAFLYQKGMNWVETHVEATEPEVEPEPRSKTLD